LKRAALGLGSGLWMSRVHDGTPTSGPVSKSRAVLSELPRTRGWHRNKGPLPLLARREGRSVGDCRPQWFDHAYRLRLPGVGASWIYVSEPYDLYDTKADFAFLRANGYTVRTIRAEARHYPGHTIAIIIEEVG
jgi:hypothetical protein